MSGIEDGIRAVTDYAADDSHGYKLGYHTAAQMKSDTDCSGLVRLYAATVEGVGSVDSYPDFSTRTERGVLMSRGWTSYAFTRDKVRRGDVLLTNRKGHTVISLDNCNTIAGAEGDWDGVHGDGPGNEVCVRSYYDYCYDYILRPPARFTQSQTTSKEDNMQPHDVWEYCWSGDKTRQNTYNKLGHVYSLIDGINAAAKEILRSDDAAGDGRKNGWYVRLCWIDRRVRVLDKMTARFDSIDKRLSEIEKKLK